MVLALGRTLLDPTPGAAPLLLLATEFLRTLVFPLVAVPPLTLSLLPARGREEVGLVMCNFC